MKSTAVERLERRWMLWSGGFDPTFAGGGLIHDVFDVPFGKAHDVAVQQDGKVLVAASARDDDSFVVRRYLSTGQPDSTFGNAGTATIQYAGKATALALEVQRDGRILVAGVAGDYFAIARLNSNGALDSSFSGDGKQTVYTYSSQGAVQDIIEQPDGRILLGGAIGQNFGLARLLADGSIDTTFAPEGFVQQDFGNGEAINSIALRPDGRIVAAGYGSTDAGGLQIILLAGFTAQGQLDPSFGNNGSLKIDKVGKANAVALTPAGKIVVGGTWGSSYYSYYGAGFLTRLSANGATDSTFNGGQIVVIEKGADDRSPPEGATHGVADLALAPDGSIYYAGGDTVGRATAAGALDASYGQRVGLYPYGTEISGLRLLPNNKLVVALSSRTAKIVEPGTDSVDTHVGGIVQLNLSGKLDISFGVNGRAAPDVIGMMGQFNGLFVMPNGQFVVVGTTLSLRSGSPDFLIERHNADGSMDSNFGTAGRITIDFDGRDDVAHAVTVQPDGRIIVAGGSSDIYYDSAFDQYISDDLIAFRLNADGALDHTFATAGIYRVGKQPSYSGYGYQDYFTTVVTLPDGSIFAGAKSSTGSSVTQFTPAGKLNKSFGKNGVLALGSRVTGIIPLENQRLLVSTENVLVRLKLDGSYDKTFGLKGKANLGDIVGALYAIALTPDGKIVAAGEKRDGMYTGGAAVFRFNANGTLDTTFGKKGAWIAPFDGNSYFFGDVVVQPDGKIITFGGSTARLNLDGTVDASFGDSGYASPDLSYGEPDELGVAAAITPTGKLIIAGAAYISRTDHEFGPGINQLLLEDGSATLSSNGTLIINGRAQHDNIRAFLHNGKLKVTLNGESRNFTLKKVKRIQINGGGGADTLTNQTPIRATLAGGSGNDRLYGGDADELLVGNGGNDRIAGGAGKDVLVGGAGRDHLYGDAGDDLLSARDNSRDTCFGGAGSDSGAFDSKQIKDAWQEIETLI
jgi:uncharacterized delta-60 repeat protein